MSRRLLFHRDFTGYTGGHGKVHDYFVHAGAHADWQPKVHMSASSTMDGNPWASARAAFVDSFDPAIAHALFLGGFDWERYPQDLDGLPVVNLVQHVRHGDPTHPLSRFLSRPAVRICVSESVADAIRATGRVRGPIHVIEAALNLPPAPASDAPRRGIFIDAIKQPGLGRQIASLLGDRPDVVLSQERMDRTGYLAALARSRIAVLLPHPTEGFYLPALEAMALGCATVVPDCVGNRAYLASGGNSLVPDWTADAFAAAIACLESDPALRERMVADGRATAGRFSLTGERAAFHRLLDALPELWRQT